MDSMFTSSLAGGPRFYALFGVLDRSIVSLPEVWAILDKELLIGSVNGVNYDVAKRISYCRAGLSFAGDRLKEYGDGAIFPGRAALLTMIGWKSVEHLKSAEYCLVFQDYTSFLVLLRAAFGAIAMLRFLSEDDSRIREWIRLTGGPAGKLSSKDYGNMEAIEKRAWKIHCEALNIPKSMNSWQRRVFNSMAHVNLYGLIQTANFANGDADAPTDTSFTREVLRVLKEQPGNKESTDLNQESSVERLRIWGAYASFLLSHVLQLHDTIVEVTGDIKDTERSHQKWRTIVKEFLGRSDVWT